jgi:hypothetical protein
LNTEPISMKHKFWGPFTRMIVKVDNGAQMYNMKEESCVEGPMEPWGIRPLKRNSKVDWDEVRKLTLAGKVNLLPFEL